ncbi:MAG: hypothetical protein ACR2IT_06300 [Pirellulales bacterium]
MCTVWMRRQHTLSIALALAAAVAGGCKSGSSWTAKPSWWTFGDASKDPAALASAPPAPTDVTKPSAAAKPYPTTTTPEGYVLDKAQAAGTANVAAAAVSAPVEPAAVTYGSTPVAAPVASQTAAASPPAAATVPGSLSSISPQVGPYGGVPGSSPIDQSLPATSTAGYPAPLAGNPAQSPAMAAPAAAVGVAAATAGFDPAGTRVADARGAESWPAPAATAPAGGGDSRYGAVNGSRFSGGTPAMPAAPPATETLSPAVPPAEMPPAATPGGVAPPAPTRRPDPGYRPGGTSSYRPSRTILAGDPGEAPSAVQPASYQEAIPAG